MIINSTSNVKETLARKVFNYFSNGLIRIAGVLDLHVTRGEKEAQGSILLPCPFCAGAPKLIDLYHPEIACDCGLKLVVEQHGKKPLVELWNKRNSIDSTKSN